MPSLSSPNQSLSRRTTRLPITVSMLTAFVALPRAHTFTTPTPAAAPGRSPVAVAVPTPLPAPKAGKATTAASNAPVCHAVMQRLSGSLVAMSSTANKPSTVMIDVDRAGVMIVCNHSDSVAIPIPGGKPR